MKISARLSVAGTEHEHYYSNNANALLCVSDKPLSTLGSDRTELGDVR